MRDTDYSGAETIGMRLRLLRKKNHMTQADMGKIMHVTASSISAYERDEYPPDYMYLAEIIRIFRVDANWMMLGSEKRNRIMTEVNEEERNVLDSLRRLDGDRRNVFLSFLAHSRDLF